jgi:hypothetical protein
MKLRGQGCVRMALPGWATERPPAARHAARAAAGATAWRDRLRTPVTTLPVCLGPGLYGHTACHQGPPRAGRRVRAAAACQARARAPLSGGALRWAR